MHGGGGTAWPVLADAVGTTAASLTLGVLLTRAVPAPPAATLAAIFVGLLIPAAAAASVVRRRPAFATAADRVTLLRGVVGGGCATLVTLSLMGELASRSWLLVFLALPAFLLDGVDGWLARATESSTPAGGRLDMETDAAFLVVLSIALVPTVGAWVLAIGAMRYLFWLAARWRPALRHPLAFSHFRRSTAGIQGGVLVGALLPAVPPVLAATISALALVLLLISFGRDTVTLERADPSRAHATSTPNSPPLVTPPR